MAFVYAICGAGGKTTFCKKMAESFLYDKNKVCIITTTHMWNCIELSDVRRASRLDYSKVIYFGNVCGEKIAPISDEEYSRICDIFDYVFVEADGSAMKPLKIPRVESEPVVPSNVDEIVVLMGLESIGREFTSVCQHSELLANNQYILSKYFDRIGITCKRESLYEIYEKVKNDLIVDDELIEDIVRFYYIEPLKKQYPNATIHFERISFTNSHNYLKCNKIAFVLLAAGFSKRYGEHNKLVEKILLNSIEARKSAGYFSINNTKNSDTIESKAMYEIMIDKLLDTKTEVTNRFCNELHYNNMKIDVAVVTQYNEILSDTNYENAVVMIKNDSPELGISNSIKLATERFIDYDAIVFVNADIPKLPVKELEKFVFNSICSDSGISSMYSGIEKNPAYFERQYSKEILNVSGDIGLRQLLKKYKMTSYKYHINDEYLFDIDTKEDMDRL